MTQRMTVLERVRRYIGHFLTAGAVLSMGLLSFASLLALLGSGLGAVIAAAILGFVFAGLIEASVYSVNVKEGLEKLRFLKYFRIESPVDNQAIKKALIREIERIAQNKKVKVEKNSMDNRNSMDNSFYACYQRLKESADDESKQKLCAINEAINNLFWSDNGDSKRQAIVREIYGLFGEQNTEQNNGKAPVLATIDDQWAIMKALKHPFKVAAVLERKQAYWLGIGLVLSLFSGIGMGCLTASAVATALGVLGVASTVIPVLWPLAAGIAGIAYAVIVYNSVVNCITDPSVTARLRAFKDWICKGSGEKGWEGWHVLKVGSAVVGLFVLGTIVIGGTLATAGTSLYAMKGMMTLLAPAVTTVGVWVSQGICWGMTCLTGIGGLLFSINSAIQTASMVGALTASKIQASLKAKYAKVKETLKKENFLQWINPFRVIYIAGLQLIKLLVFIAHIVSLGAIYYQGLAAETKNGVMEWLAVFFSAGLEASDDFPFLELTAGDHCQSKRGGTGDELDGPQHASAHHDHDHDGYIQKAVLTFLHIPIAIVGGLKVFFDCGASQLNRLWFWKKEKDVIGLGAFGKQFVEAVWTQPFYQLWYHQHDEGVHAMSGSSSTSVIGTLSILTSSSNISLTSSSSEGTLNTSISSSNISYNNNKKLTQSLYAQTDTSDEEKMIEKGFSCSF